MVMNAWFDTTSRDWVNRKDDEEGLRESAGYINKYVPRRCKYGSSSQRTLLSCACFTDLSQTRSMEV